MEQIGKDESLDLNGVPGVEAIIATLGRAQKLSAGERLAVTLAEIPFQLYDLLQQRGCVIQYERQPGGKVVGLVQRKSQSVQA